MNSAIDRFTSLAPKILGILRILAGVLFTCYGAQKMLGAFGGLPPGAGGWMVTLSGTIELTGGALIAIGLFTRPAAFLCSGLMAFAYFIGHAGEGFWPVLNGGSAAIFYCFYFLYLSAAGAGPLSLDALVGRKRRGAEM